MINTLENVQKEEEKSEKTYKWELLMSNKRAWIAGWKFGFVLHLRNCEIDFLLGVWSESISFSD